MERGSGACRALGLIGALVIVMAGAAGAVAYPPTFRWIVRGILEVHSMGLLGIAIFFFCYPVALTIGFPVSLLDMTMGFLYHWAIALLLVWTGKTLGSACCYGIAVFGCKRSFQAWAHQNSFLRLLPAILKRHPWKYSFLLRLVFIPATLKNYGLAALQIPFPPYIVSSLSLDLVMSLWLVLIGGEGRTVFQAKVVKIGTGQAVGMAIAAVLSISAIVLLVLVTRSVLREIHLLSEVLRESQEDL